MARGRDRKRRQRETLLQLDRPQEGKSEEWKWSRNGLGLPARGAAREPLKALRLLAAAWALQGFPQGPGERVPLEWLRVTPGEDGSRFVTRHGACRSVCSLLPCQPRKYHEGAHTWGNRDKEAPGPHSVGTGIIPCPSTHQPVSAGSVKTSFKHRGGEVHVQRASKAANPQPQRPQGQGSCRVRGRG